MISRISRYMTAAALCGVFLAGCNAVEDVREEPFTPIPAANVALQGTISGLGSRRSVVLMNNGNTNGAVSFQAAIPTEPTNDIPITPFSFGAVPVGSPYNIEVRTQPYGKNCTVAGGTGVVSTPEALNIVVTCVNNIARYPLTVTIPATFGNLPGAKVRLTTEEAVFEQAPAAGQTKVVFPDSLFRPNPADTTAPAFTWTVTASITEGEVTSKCTVTNPTGNNPAADPGVAPAAATAWPTVGTPAGTPGATPCSFTVGGSVTYSLPSTGGAAPAMPAGGVTLQLRTVKGVLKSEVTVPAYSAAATTQNFTFPVSATDATAQVFRSNADSVFDVVVSSHPAGQYCVVSNGSNASLYVTGLTNPVSVTAATLQVFCRARPALANQLKGTYRLTSQTADIRTTSASTATPPNEVVDRVVTVPWQTATNVQNTSNVIFMTFFEDGTFLYGTHGSSQQVEHGFYEYNPTAATLRFRLHTDTNTSTTFPTGFSLAASPGSTTPGLSATPGSVTVGGVVYRALTNVQRSMAGDLRRITGTYGPLATRPANGVVRLDWELTEAKSEDGQMSGAYVSQDHRRVWIYDNDTSYGFHMGVNYGAANLQSSCFTMDDITATSGFYIRRGSSTGCYPFLRPAAGALGILTFQETADFHSPALAQLPGVEARIPGGQSAFDGRSPSPILYRVASVATFPTLVDPEVFPAESFDWCTTDIYAARATLHGTPINRPVFLCRERAN